MLCINSCSENFLKNKTVLLRVDYNVPLEGKDIMDTTRIKNSLETINFLKIFGARVVIISHLGRPQFKELNKSLEPISIKLSDMLRQRVIFCHDCIGSEVENVISSMRSGDVVLLENLRFHVEEEECDIKFAENLTAKCDIYVNDAFSVSHRKHASIVQIPKLLPSFCGISFCSEKEYIDNFLNRLQSRSSCIIGGGKISTKIELLKKLVTKVDVLAVAGAIGAAFAAFLQCKSDSETCIYSDYYQCIAEILDLAKKYDCEVVIPSDFLLSIGSESKKVKIDQCSCGDFEKIADIGTDSTREIISILESSKSVLWNGPVGIFENPLFEKATRLIAKKIADLSVNNNILSLVGGGDTVFALNKFNVFDQVTYASTSGGAFLEYVEGKNLPGICALEETFLHERRNNIE